MGALISHIAHLGIVRVLSVPVGMAVVMYLLFQLAAPPEELDGDLPAGLRSLRPEKAQQLKTAAGVVLGLGANAEITGEYRFLGMRQSGLSWSPSGLDRTFDTGLDALGLSLSLSIKY